MNIEFTKIIIGAKSQRSAVCKIAHQLRRANSELSQSLCMKSAWLIVKSQKTSKVVKGFKGFTPSSPAVIARRRLAERKALNVVTHDQRLISSEEYFAAKKAA